MMMMVMLMIMTMKKKEMNMVIVYFVHCHQPLQGLLLSFHWQLKQICLIQVLGNGHDHLCDYDDLCYYKDLGDDDYLDDLYDDDDEYFSTEEVRGACLLSPVSDASAHLCKNLNQSIARLWQHFLMNPVEWCLIWFHLNIDHAWVLRQDVACCKSHLQIPFNLEWISVSPK